MTFRQIKMAVYSLFLTNFYGFKLKNSTLDLKKDLRLDYSKKILDKLNIDVKVNNKNESLSGQYLIVINHKSILDPLITEIALANTNIKGYWVAKEELAKSIFFGAFVRNAGTILIDRENTDVKKLFKEATDAVKQNASVFIFPEGNRNKTKEPLQEFKAGANIIALKNKLPILPIYIKTDVGKASKKAIQTNTKQTIEVEIGEIISYKERKLEDKYRTMFGIN